MPESAQIFANLASVGPWIAEVKALPLDRARAAVLAGLSAFARGSTTLTADNIKSVVHSEDQFAPIFQDTLHMFLRNPALSKQALVPLTQTVGDSYGNLAQIYHRFIAAHANDRALPDELFAMLASRATFALAARLKWASFRQEQLDASGWQALHHLYRIAEARGVAQRVVSVYRGHDASPAQAYVKALLLATLANGAFSAREMQTADEWLNGWTAGMQLDEQFDRNLHYYYVDLADTGGARRIIGASAGKQLRFLSTDPLALQIERTKLAFRQGQAKASGGIDPVSRAGEYAEFLDKAERIWSPTWMRSDQRSHRRVPANGEVVAVVRGLRAITTAAAQDHELEQGPSAAAGVLSQEEEFDLKIYGFVREQTRAKQMKDRAAAMAPERESWTLLDESINGYGATMPIEFDADLRLGSLIGIKRTKSNRWAVGYIARKVVRVEESKLFVGVEILSHTPVVVSLTPEGEKGSEGDVQPALFMPGDQGRGRADSLIVDAALYAAGKDFTLAARNVSYFIRMPRVIRKGQGWQRVAFEVLAKKN